MTPGDAKIAGDLDSIQALGKNPAPAAMDAQSKKLLTDLFDQFNPQGQALLANAVVGGAVKSPKDQQKFVATLLKYANNPNQVGPLTKMVIGGLLQLSAQQKPAAAAATHGVAAA